MCTVCGCGGASVEGFHLHGAGGVSALALNTARPGNAFRLVPSAGDDDPRRTGWR